MRDHIYALLDFSFYDRLKIFFNDEYTRPAPILHLWSKVLVEKLGFLVQTREKIFWRGSER
jgi:hypothetical protein